MPVYEYICQKCSERFEILQGLYPPENNAECPKCSSRDVKKALSSFSCSAGNEPAPRFSGGG